MELREALETAYDEIEAGSNGAAPVPETAETAPASPPDAEAEPAPTSEETAEQKAERARDETGRFVKEKPAAKASPVRGSTTPPPKAGPTTGTQKPEKALPTATAVPVAPVQSQTRPPQSWKPAERAAWASVPPEAQSAILRREREVEQALQRAAESGKGYSAYTDAVRPYEAMIRATGQEPHQYVSQVLQSAHALTYGPPHVQADTFASLILQLAPHLVQQTGVDENGIPQVPLAQAILARVQGRQAPQAQQQIRDPRFDQFLAQLQQQKQARAEEEAAAASEHATSFGESHEFYEDVKDHMADILDVWAKQGKTKIGNDDLERAYTLACQMNPDVAPLLQQRRAAEAAQKAAASTARARTAASSPKNSPTAAPAAQPKGLRAVLEAKADELGL